MPKCLIAAGSCFAAELLQTNQSYDCMPAQLMTTQQTRVCFDFTIHSPNGVNRVSNNVLLLFLLHAPLCIAIDCVTLVRKLRLDPVQRSPTSAQKVTTWIQRKKALNNRGRECKLNEVWIILISMERAGALPRGVLGSGINNLFITAYVIFVIHIVSLCRSLTIYSHHPITFGTPALFCFWCATTIFLVVPTWPPTPMKKFWRRPWPWGCGLSYT